MNMEEGHRTSTRMVQMELIDGIATDGCVCCKHIAQKVGNGIGHHAAVRETTTIDTLSVNGILGGHILNNGLSIVDVTTPFTSGIPAGQLHITKEGELDVLTVSIDYDDTLRIGDSVESGLLVV